MAANKIYFKKSDLSGAIPPLSSISSSELAINLVDGRIFLKQTPVIGDITQDKIVTFLSSKDYPYTLNTSFSSINTIFGNNITYQVFGTTLGGLDNENYGATATIVNGELNKIYSDFAFIGNGYNNAIYLSGAFSTILNGENNIIALSGNHSSILGGSNNRIDHENSFILGSNLTSFLPNFTYVNNLSVQGTIYGNNNNISGDLIINNTLQVGDVNSNLNFIITEEGKVGINTETPNEKLTVVGNISATGLLYGDGSNITSIDASHIINGTLSAARMPAFEGDITTTVGSTSATVIAIQGEPISTQYPSNGQVLQWNGIAWTPGTIPPGGSGGGLVYFLNQALSGESPTNNLPLSAAQLGRTGILDQTTLTSPHLSQASYTLIAGFVTDVLDPNLDSIPGGIWDFNVWGYSNANVNNPTVIRALVYKYNNVDAPTLLSTSNDTTLANSGLLIQHAMACLVPQTELSATDRIYIEIRGKASTSNKHVTLGFGDSTPSHIHTTLPSVGGSGLVKVIDGVTRSPASLLVNTDVANNAAIDQSKINGLTELANKSNSTFTTVQSNSSINWNNSIANQYAHTNFLPLTGGNLTGELTTTSTISSSQTISASGARVITGLPTDSTPVYYITVLTQSEYDAIALPNSNTLYFIKP